MNNWPKSNEYFKRAQESIPGGVNSPVRAFRGVGGDPLFISRGQGPFVWDADGNQYIDLVASWGPLILGHAHPEVLEAIRQAAVNGTSYGAPTLLEIELAEMVREAFPSMHMVRMVNSGTEATMTALRLARAVTGREIIVKFEGCYHGHSDSLLIKAGSGAMTLGVPSSPGVPKALAQGTINLSYNDLAGVRQVFGEMGKQIAAVIVEPVAANMGLILPQTDFLEGLREVTRECGSLLIFDEVITGFRVAYGGYQELSGIEPDLTCLGKIIGGGLPVGAFGGKQEIMENLAPLGPVYQAGTLSGNPLAMAAGKATLNILRRPGFYELLETRTNALVTGLISAARSAGIADKITFTQIGSIWGSFFTAGPVRDFQEALKSDTSAYSSYFWAMMQNGVYLAPSQFEAAFLSYAHQEKEIERIIFAAEKSFKEAGLVVGG